MTKINNTKNNSDSSKIVNNYDAYDMTINLTSLNNSKNGIDCSYNPYKPEILESMIE